MDNGQAEAVTNVVRDATAGLATQADLNSALAGLEGRLNDRLDAHDAKLDSALAAHNERLDAHDAKLGSALAAHNERLDAHDAKLGSALAAHNERLDAHDAKLGSALAAHDAKLVSALAAQEGRLRGELYKALWVFGLGIITVNVAIVSAAVGIALWVWPPGAG